MPGVEPAFRIAIEDAEEGQRLDCARKRRAKFIGEAASVTDAEEMEGTRQRGSEQCVAHTSRAVFDADSGDVVRLAESNDPAVRKMRPDAKQDPEVVRERRQQDQRASRPPLKVNQRIR